MINVHRKPCLYFILPVGRGDSGQRRATELIYDLLPKDMWSYKVLPVPILERGRRNRSFAIPKYVIQLVFAWLRIFATVRSNGIIHWTIGQTQSSWIRDGIPIGILRKFLSGIKLVVSIHGSNFLEWGVDTPKGRKFRTYLMWCDKITVLGKVQYNKMLNLGIPEEKLVVLPNCSEFNLLNEVRLQEKLDQSSSRPVKILFLSSLIDTKGYPTYLEAIDRLSQQVERPFEAILCGRLTGSQFSERFGTNDEAEKWISSVIERINTRREGTVRWVRGAWGNEKGQLYADADILVLPTTYKVEAQPLVLLEAMAHGCALVTSTVGEIATTIRSDEAILLNQISTETVTDAIRTLIHNDDQRRSMGKNGWLHYGEEFTPRIYRRSWVNLLESL